MLYIRFGHYDDFSNDERILWDPDGYFEVTYEEDWFEDELVKEMIKDVDKSIVLAPNCIQSPILGQIPPATLSGGVKALILMLKDPTVIVDATLCGNNCAKWILKIAEKIDLHIVLGYYMKFNSGDINKPMKGIIENDGTILNTILDYEKVASRYSAKGVLQ